MKINLINKASEKSEVDKVLKCLALELPQAVYNDAIPRIRKALADKDATIQAMAKWMAAKTGMLCIDCPLDGKKCENLGNCPTADELIARFTQED